MNKTTKIRAFLTGAAAAVFLAACDSGVMSGVSETPNPGGLQTSMDSAFSGGTVLATVNGRPITQSLYDAYAAQRGIDTNAASQPGTREKLLDELLKTELLMQDALDKGLDSSPEVAAQLSLQRRNTLVGAEIQQHMGANPVSEEEQRTLYEERIASQPKEEYRARHILTKTEEEARSLIGELDNGADFAELARNHSIGPSAQAGGDLGWFPPHQMVPQFSQALVTLENGAYTKDPVQTQYGWHVILLEDRRESAPPSYENMQGRIAAAIRAQRIQQLVDQLQAAANITVTPPPQPPETPAPAAPEPAPPAAPEPEPAGGTE